MRTLARIIVPPGNWLMKLADAIEQATDGDVIVVASADAKELAEDAKSRMAPNKQITFEVEAPANPFA